MPSTKVSSQANIDLNVNAHDRVASTYDSKHIEIYNKTEQNRINLLLKEAITLIKTNTKYPSVLDFGSGTGNLTKHLLALEAKVIAGDVSSNSLKYLTNKLQGYKHLTTTILNGRNLANFSDNSFDMVVAYSVLHHVPDYLGIIDEFIRVTKPGGLILIDHEVCPSYWEGNEHYLNYLKALSSHFFKIYQFEIGIRSTSKSNTVISKIIAILKNTTIIHHSYQFVSKLTFLKSMPRNEGDLHTSKDDHIEWGKIRKKLSQHCSIIEQDDYLVCREKENPPIIWNIWKDLCKDMRLIVAQKQEETECTKQVSSVSQNSLQSIFPSIFQH